MYAHAAIHEPRPEHFAEAKRILTELSQQVITGADGLLEAYVGEDLTGRRIMAVTMWEHEDDLERFLPTIIEAVGATPVRGWAAVPPRVIRFDEQAG